MSFAGLIIGALTLSAAAQGPAPEKAPTPPETVNAQQQAAFLGTLKRLKEELSRNPDRVVCHKYTG